jgi:GT2 family glycosyltransferase
VNIDKRLSTVSHGGPNPWWHSRRRGLPGTGAGPSPKVSFVVPAYNAAATLAEAVGSIRAQTFGDWEAVIVDDGSTDDTAAMAMRYVEEDPRFRLIRQHNRGLSAARNAGIRVSQGEWLVFLDSDDWLAPEYLDLMVRKVAAHPNLAAVVCGCVRVTPSGGHHETAIYEPPSMSDPFPAFAVDCPIAIHNCTVRRSLVETLGGFDTTLDSCQDWDFWQRVARTTSPFGTVQEVLAFYRTRPGSISSKADRALVNGWIVIRRGHAADPRVPAPDPRYATGMPVAGLPEALYRQAVWAASIMLAQGKDARSLLPLMGEQRAASLAPELVAGWLFRSVPHAASREADYWPTLWPEVVKRLTAYLEALEVQSGANGLANRCGREIERLLSGLRR